MSWPEAMGSHTLKEGRRAYFFVIAGQAQVNGHELSGGDQARIQGESELRFTASTPSEVILIDLP
jgi:redox-sensitive bicupin YhaK (pirin superfamily)